jgi:hypothetical protein
VSAAAIKQRRQQNAPENFRGVFIFQARGFLIAGQARRATWNFNVHERRRNAASDQKDRA